jgi:peptidylprolyl isomerase
MRLKLCCAAVAVVLMLAGCGDDSSSGGGDEPAATNSSQTTTMESARFENTLPKPRSPGPHPNARVDQLVVRDVRVGEGPEIHAGDTGVFDFIGTNYGTGRPLDAAWGRRRPFEAAIERGVVIDGWWQGIPGMRVGGRRQIIIPPALGFTGPLQRDLRDATTYFDIVLLEVRPATPEGLREDAPAG